MDSEKVTIYVRPGVTDMRKVINGLSMIASEEVEASAGRRRLVLEPAE